MYCTYLEYVLVCLVLCWTSIFCELAYRLNSIILGLDPYPMFVVYIKLQYVVIRRTNNFFFKFAKI